MHSYDQTLCRVQQFEKDMAPYMDEAQSNRLEHLVYKMSYAAPEQWGWNFRKITTFLSENYPEDIRVLTLWQDTIRDIDGYHSK